VQIGTLHGEAEDAEMHPWETVLYARPSEPLVRGAELLAQDVRMQSQTAGHHEMAAYWQVWAVTVVDGLLPLDAFGKQLAS
jgi:hypothetical protein